MLGFSFLSFQPIDLSKQLSFNFLRRNLFCLVPWLPTLLNQCVLRNRYVNAIPILTKPVNEHPQTSASEKESVRPESPQTQRSRSQDTAHDRNKDHHHRQKPESLNL